MQARQGRRDQIAIRTGEKFTLVQAEELVHASLVDDSIIVATQTMYGTSNYRTLDELQARLDPAVFWRVHRSHLVNITKIKEVVPWFSRNYLLKMKDPKTTEIPVSRAQTRRLREYLQIVGQRAEGKGKTKLKVRGSFGPVTFALPSLCPLCPLPVE